MTKAEKKNHKSNLRRLKTEQQKKDRDELRLKKRKENADKRKKKNLVVPDTTSEDWKHTKGWT